MELVNAIYQLGADKEVFSKLIILLSPIVPHFAEELWQISGNQGSIVKAGWPEYDPRLLIEENIIIVVQVNGKVRSKVEVPAVIDEEKLKQTVLTDSKLKSWIQDKPVKKFIIVPQKLVNVVI
jgi:leucyl-tRNA synthetase